MLSWFESCGRFLLSQYLANINFFGMRLLSDIEAELAWFDMARRCSNVRGSSKLKVYRLATFRNVLDGKFTIMTVTHDNARHRVRRRLHRRQIMVLEKVGHVKDFE